MDTTFLRGKLGIIIIAGRMVEFRASYLTTTEQRNLTNVLILLAINLRGSVSRLLFSHLSALNGTMHSLLFSLSFFFEGDTQGYLLERFVHMADEEGDRISRRDTTNENGTDPDCLCRGPSKR